MRRTASFFLIWNAICVHVGKFLFITILLFYFHYFDDKRSIERKIDIKPDDILNSVN